MTFYSSGTSICFLRSISSVVRRSIICEHCEIVYRPACKRGMSTEWRFAPAASTLYYNPSRRHVFDMPLKNSDVGGNVGFHRAYMADPGNNGTIIKRLWRDVHQTRFVRLPFFRVRKRQPCVSLKILHPHSTVVASIVAGWQLFHHEQVHQHRSFTVGCSPLRPIDRNIVTVNYWNLCFRIQDKGRQYSSAWC